MIANPTFIAVDLFCGAGGVTTGLVNSGVVKVIACVNHDHKAILSHKYNHPDVKHFEEDIKTMHLEDLMVVVQYWRNKYPSAKLVLHASLECTNYSKAKGGMAKDADSRTLADYLHRYIIAINPDYVTIENVVEFMDWGPLQIKPKKYYKTTDGYEACELTMIKDKHKTKVYGWMPVPETKGQDFRRWCAEMLEHGYHMDWREVDSADFGASTKRPRLFGMFARHGMKIVWPVRTHTSRERLMKLLNKTKKKAKKLGRKEVDILSNEYTFFSNPKVEMNWNNIRNIPEVLLEELKPWMAVKYKIDFTDVGYSIFHRARNTNIPARFRKEISENTFKRVYAGCIKHIAGGMDAFLMKYHGSKDGVNERTSDLEAPLTVIDTQNRHALAQMAFLSSYHGNGHNTHSLENPGPVIPTGDGNALVQTELAFIDKTYSGTANHQSKENPLGVIMNKDHYAPMFVDRQFSGGGQNSSLEEPIGSLLAVPKSNVLQAQLAFIDTQQYGNTPSSPEEPLPVITANRKWPCLYNPSHGGSFPSLENPCPVIVARQDKAPLSLVITEEGHYAIQIFPDDSPTVRKLKEFMALYGIVDIKMRMLKVVELLDIQGFPRNYKLSGNQADQKKFIGNSVVPDVMAAWALAMHNELAESHLKAA